VGREPGARESWTDVVETLYRPLVETSIVSTDNAPGSKHVKRWQDVLELLDAGIDVHAGVGYRLREPRPDPPAG
jgi:hypothetical protein